MKSQILATLMLLSGLFIFGHGKVSAQDKPPTKAELDANAVGRIYTIANNAYSSSCVKDPLKISPKDVRK